MGEKLRMLPLWGLLAGVLTSLVIVAAVTATEDLSTAVFTI